MYRPLSFQENDAEVLADFMASYPFVTLVTAEAHGAPFATHLPVLVRREPDGGTTLLGHVARANPHWRQWDGQREALAVFHGPHAYVSPSWYSEHPSVPTWNYATVHACGRPRVLEDPARIAPILEQLVAAEEAHRPEPWAMDLPDDYWRGMVAAVVGFEMRVEQLEGKFKLSQNRTAAEREAVAAALEAEPGTASRALGAFMRQHPAATTGRD